VHLLNYTNPDAQHGWLQSTYPLGTQTVTLKLPPGVRVRSIEFLSSGQTSPVHLEDQVLKFTLPRVEDYEVAAVTVA
jgi:hypothetical protein